MKLVTYDSPQAVCHCWKLSGHPESQLTIEMCESFMTLSANPSIVHTANCIKCNKKCIHLTQKCLKDFKVLHAWYSQAHKHTKKQELPLLTVSKSPQTLSRQDVLRMSQ